MGMLVLLILVTLVAATIGGAVLYQLSRDSTSYGRRGRGSTLAGVGGFVGSGAVVFFLMWLIVTWETVDEGNVAVKVTWGQADDDHVTPGVHFVAPWTNLVEFSTREQVIAFEGDEPEREAKGLDDVSMQTKGGGSFDLDARVRIRLPKDKAVEVFRTLGTDYNDQATIPSGRECLRDASVDMELTHAITNGRSEIAQIATDCLETKLTEPYGIVIVGVELGGTDLPGDVQVAIDAKQAAEQARQTEAINLEKAKDTAARKTIEAKATSDAERIIACGGKVETVKVDGEDVERVVPNEVCERQFSEEFLEWLWITTLPDVEANVTVLDPRLLEGSDPLVTIPAGQ